MPRSLPLQISKYFFLMLRKWIFFRTSYILKGTNVIITNNIIVSYESLAGVTHTFNRSDTAKMQTTGKVIGWGGGRGTFLLSTACFNHGNISKCVGNLYFNIRNSNS